MSDEDRAQIVLGSLQEIVDKVEHAMGEQVARYEGVANLLAIALQADALDGATLKAAEPLLNRIVELIDEFRELFATDLKMVQWILAARAEQIRNSR